MTDFDRFFQEQFNLETFNDIFITSFDWKQFPPNLKLDKRVDIVVDEVTEDNCIPGLHAGGGVVRSAASMIFAMGDGRKTSCAVHRYLKGKPESAYEPDDVDEEP